MERWANLIRGQKRTSADLAKDRLRLVLINDRTDISPDKMESLKNEMLEVISRYVDIDPSMVRIQMTQEGRGQKLVADIPLKPVLRRRIG